MTQLTLVFFYVWRLFWLPCLALMIDLMRAFTILDLELHLEMIARGYTANRHNPFFFFFANMDLYHSNLHILKDSIYKLVNKLKTSLSQQCYHPHIPSNIIYPLISQSRILPCSLATANCSELGEIATAEIRPNGVLDVGQFL